MKASRSWRDVQSLLLLILMTAAPPAAWSFDFGDVAERAEKLSRQGDGKPQRQVPPWLLEISYDQWRDIRFRTDRALWSDSPSPFHVQFFHPGRYYDRPVEINVIDSEGVHPVPFSPAMFDYGKNKFASRVPQDLGYAGFRLHYPLNKPGLHDEVTVFLGASYFRAVGKQQGFGISARGLAIDTGLPSGEEFPWFREFWLVRPAPDADGLVVYALLDSPSVTGAYRFVIHPGEQTMLETRAKLFPRVKIKKLGLAPLTSMFLHGENSLREFNDYRPEVHDSDGLMIHLESGEWLWRPLDNPERLAINTFKADNVQGFGLLQRDRNFDNYQDLETRQETRPSLWVEPEDDWGEGRVELVEIPTHDDKNDNIVAFWIPDETIEPGDSLELSYKTHWYLTDSSRPPGGRVVSTHRDSNAEGDVHHFVVDFEGSELEKLPAGTVMRGMITVGSDEKPEGELLGQYVVKNPVTGGWRLSFRVRPGEDRPIEHRAFLQTEEEVLTETWSYSLRP